MLGTIGIIIVVVLAFSLLILIHEFGHFIVAKLSGVWVEEFGLGLPPRIFGKKIGDTIYSLNWLPIGGFVRLHGETSEEGVTKPTKAFVNKSKKARIAISIAGVIMNFILAIVCFAIVFSIMGIPTGKVLVKVINVANDTPAATAGFLSGDVVKKVGTNEITNTEEFKSKIDEFRGKRVEIDVIRNEKETVLTVTPRVNPPDGQGPLGVEISDIPQIYFPPIWQRPFVAAWYGTKQAVTATKAVIFGLGEAAKDASHGKVPEHSAGIVGIFAIFVYFAKTGLIDVVNLIGVISLNLAVINLVPFPPLDGSRILSVIIEGIFGKKLESKIEEKINLIGFAILIGLAALISVREIVQLIHAGSITTFVESILK